MPQGMKRFQTLEEAQLRLKRDDAVHLETADWKGFALYSGGITFDGAKTQNADFSFRTLSGRVVYATFDQVYVNAV
jgi:hypothetical protein